MNRPRKYGALIKFVAFLYLLYLCVARNYLDDVIDTWYIKHDTPKLKKYQMDMDV